MKKTLLLIPMVLFGCGGYVQNENGSENLIQLDEKPNDCTFLYKINVDVAVYDEDDAIRYLENKIMEQDNPGNAYTVVSQKTKQNPSAIFGPKNTYIFIADVYDCPNK